MCRRPVITVAAVRDQMPDRTTIYNGWVQIPEKRKGNVPLPHTQQGYDGFREKDTLPRQIGGEVLLA